MGSRKNRQQNAALNLLEVSRSAAVGAEAEVIDERCYFPVTNCEFTLAERYQEEVRGRRAARPYERAHVAARHAHASRHRACFRALRALPGVASSAACLRPVPRLGFFGHCSTFCVSQVPILKRVYTVVDKASFLDWGLTSDYKMDAVDGEHKLRDRKAASDTGGLAGGMLPLPTISTQYSNDLPSAAQYASRKSGINGSEGCAHEAMRATPPFGPASPCVRYRAPTPHVCTAALPSASDACGYGCIAAARHYP